MKLFSIHSSVKACALVASLLTLLTASGHADNRSGNGGSGSDSGRLAVHSILPEEGLLIAGRAEDAGDLPRLLSSDGQGGLLKDGKPFRAIGVNYFSCFYRTLLDGEDNITADNERSYQLREVAEANARVQRREKPHFEK